MVCKVTNYTSVYTVLTLTHANHTEIRCAYLHTISLQYTVEMGDRCVTAWGECPWPQLLLVCSAL